MQRDSGRLVAGWHLKFYIFANIRSKLKKYNDRTTIMYVKPNKRKNNKHLKITKFDINWDAKFLELQLFHKRFGHCNVPQYWSENKILGGWVIRQRSYQQYLSPERYDKLKSIGFIFDLPDYWWKQKYNELKKYYHKNGHTEVPKGNGPYESLAEWVGKQRGDYKKKLARLTPNKIAKLNKLNFYWGVNTTPWQKRFEELKAFKKKYKHCRVKQRWEENPKLAAWVATQRTKQKYGVLKPEYFELLDGIGFIWKIKNRKIKQ